MIDESDLVYGEVQYSRQWWLWLVAGVSPIIIIALAVYAVYVQIILGKPFGNKPISDTALIIVAACIILFDIALLALVLTSKLITEVRRDGLYIRYFPFHLSFHKIPLENLDKAEPLTYSPLGEYGGWGIRYTRNGKAYNPLGNRGVKITYKDGTHILIGSQRPEELAEAIQSKLT